MVFTLPTRIIFLAGLSTIADSHLTDSAHPQLRRLTASEHPQLLRGEFSWAQELLQQRSHVEFMHIPKTGGTTIENIGFASGLKWGSYRFNNYSGFDAVAEEDDVWASAYHVPPAKASWPIRQVYSSAERVFCITRNPYDRLVSEYRYKIDRRQQRRQKRRERRRRRLRTGQQLLQGRHHIRPRVAGLYKGHDCTAEGLNIFVEKGLSAFMSGRRFMLDCHLIPQSNYIWEGEKQWCTDVLRLDGLPWNFNKLMKSFGVNAQMDGEHENPSTCQLTSAALSNKSKSLIQSVYHEDFARLGYST